MIEHQTMIVYTCDLCLWVEQIAPGKCLPGEWSIIPSACLITERDPLHFCPRCSNLAQRLFDLLSIPFDFEDRECLKEPQFNVLKPGLCDLSAFFEEQVSAEN